MKAEEFLSSALHTAKENIKQGQLQPSSIVKQGNDFTNEDFTFYVLLMSVDSLKPKSSHIY